MSAPASADGPDIDSVAPPYGLSDEATEISIRGEGFTTGTHVALVNASGLQELGSLDLPFTLYWYFWLGRARVWGERVYVFNTVGALYVVDVSDPEAPELLDPADLPAKAHASDIAFFGKYAYVAANKAGLLVLDLEDPSGPTVVNAIETFEPSSVEISNARAHVAGDGFYHVLSLDDPENPRIIGSVERPGRADSLELGDDLALIGASERLEVLDVSDPSAPRFLSSLGMPGLVYDLAYKDEFAYVAVWGSELTILDLRDASSPSVVGSEERLPLAISVTIEEDLLMVSNAWDGLWVFDIRDRVRPVHVGFIGSDIVAPFLTDTDVQEGLAYSINGDLWGDEEARLRVFDTTVLRRPAQVGSLEKESRWQGLAVADGFAFVGERTRFLVIDVLDPSSPTFIGSTEVPGRIGEIDIAEGATLAVATILDDRKGVQFIDISDHAFPRLAGLLETPGPPFCIAIRGEFAYAAFRQEDDSPASLAVIDASDPSAPFVRGTVDVPSEFWGIAVESGFVFATAGSGGLYSIDVRAPGSPEVLGHLEGFRYIQGVDVAKGYAYVHDWMGGAGWYSKLHVIDVSDPSAMAWVKTIDFPGYAGDVEYKDEVVLVANGSSGVRVVDAYDPGNAALLDSLLTLGDVFSVAKSGDHAYALVQNLGLVILKLNAPLLGIEVDSSEEIRATVPPGFVPGAYHLQALAPDGSAARLFRGYRVCLPHTIKLSLAPVSTWSPPRVTLGPIPWRAVLDGDYVLVDPGSERELLLTLPDLPEDLEVEFVAEKEPGTQTIRISLTRSPGRGRVNLIGNDELGLRALWEEIRAAEGILVPETGEGQYADVELSTQRRSSTYRSIYSYDFTDGALTAARASGPNVDHVFKATATFDRTCKVEDTVTYNETRRELCEAFAAEHPHLVTDCTY